MQQSPAMRTERAVLLATMLAVAASGAQAAQPVYPSKPIRLVSPNPPGGGTTILGRIIGQKLSELWGQWILVDNRPGGHGMIGGAAVARATPDGYTALIMTTTHIITPLMVPAPYDPIKDFQPLGSVASGENVLVVHPGVPAGNLQELIALGKAKPAYLNFATAGSGTGPHLMGELLGMMTGMKMQHIPYKGTGPAVTDVVGGQVQMMMLSPAGAMSFIASGKLRAIAITGKQRTPSLPGVPTFAEAGLQGFNVIGGWYGILAPAGTPKPVVDKWSTDLARILAMPEIRDKIMAQGNEPSIMSPEQMRDYMVSSTARVAKIIQTANIRID